MVEFLINGEPWKLKYMRLADETNYIRSLRLTDEKLFSFPDNSTIRIHELSNGDELFLKVVYKPTYDITEIDDIMYNDYVESVVAGAKRRLIAIPGQPWSDDERAMYYKAVAKRGMSHAKRIVQKGYTQEPKHVNPRAFGE